MQQEFKNIRLRHWVYIVGGVVCLICLFLLMRSCVQHRQDVRNHILRVGVDCPNGFAAELARGMAQTWGDSLVLTVSPSIDSLLLMLDQGKINLITQPLPRTEELVKNYTCSDSLYTSRFMLVRNSQMPALQNPSDLRAKTVAIAPSPALRLRLHHLMQEMADTIFVEQHKDWSVRQLLEAVDSGQVSYAVVNHQQFLRAQEGLHHICEDIPVGFYQEYVFVLPRKTDPLKLNKVNKFVKQWFKR